MNAGGGSVAAVTANTRCVSVKFRESCEIVCGHRVSIKIMNDSS